MKVQDGLTLVEILVAMAILGIVLALIINWQTQTLQLTTRTSAQAQQLADLNDMTGYIGDRVRSAVRVRVATSGLSVNSGSGNACTTSTPCLVAVMPEYTSAGTQKFVLYVYRMQDRSAVSTDDKTDDSWAENNVQVLREYRSTDTSSTPISCLLGTGETFETAAATPCAAMRNLSTLSSVSGLQPYLVSDYLTPSNTLPSGASPFVYTANTRSTTITVQSRKQVSGVIKTVPATGAYTLTVQARNVP
ncbi:prepilin-type N-terminal cleavage/methylation domain-containing protein [Deinococcus metalli]|uniref:Prepilin-type N-terminal cleavage/methylation domain-containing protein n=1 Tax=Deinococcus metalli TaxID=1141878 RepID=A0A7W8KAL9_9DEIO|nr:prepilin-type N-terminal cleavage/methylation domain-containing protein [Deinococcus metalli]MBB5374739.1 prepilin-type N-terminal cleavage/methylation domain-containing protein [Deinococcus metalli]GHF34060.1 prepilin-type N-terminal cleavage/methylation domain-containing protein [Deinococcus metalli]